VISFFDKYEEIKGQQWTDDELRNQQLSLRRDMNIQVKALFLEHNFDHEVDENPYQVANSSNIGTSVASRKNIMTVTHKS
jgi:archaellum component FlaC